MSEEPLAQPGPSQQVPSRTQPKPVRSRVPGQVVGWLVLAPLLLWAVGRVLGVDRFSPAAQLMAFTPYVAAASLIPLVLAVAIRQWWMAGVAALACLALAACVLPRAFGSPSTMDGVGLVVMSVNMREGGADTDAIVALVRDQGVDVLAVQEFTPAARDRLAASGLTPLLPYHENHPISDTRGSGLYSRYPLTDAGSTMNAGGFYQAHAMVAVPGAPAVRVESVHPLAPAVPEFIPLWIEDLRNEPPATSAGTPRILAGDFNSTVDHSELRRLLATGYQDAAVTVGKGLTPTWPYYGPRSAITPKVTLDHVLADPRVGVRDFAAHTIPFTDHRAIVARLTLPASVD